MAGPDGAAARALRATFTGAAGAARVEHTRRALTAPRPAHWRAIHATWLDAALEGEGPAVRAAVLGDGLAPHQRHLARAFLGGLVPMPGPTAGATGVAALVALPPVALVRALTVLGRRQLAHALADGSRRGLAELAAHLPWGGQLLADVVAVSTLGDAADARLGRRAAAMARLAGLVWTDPLALVRAGVRAVAPAVAAVPDLAAQLVQRLPRPVGGVARGDLAEFAAALERPGDAEIDHAIARATVGGP